jgi:hypothetical protein
LPALPRIAAGLDQWLGGGTPVLLDICVLSDQFAGRQHRLRSDLGTRSIKGKVLEQWQYEVIGAGSRSTRGTEQPYGVGAGQGVLGLDANGQQAWTTLLLSIVTVAAWPVSWLALVSPSVPTQ